MASEELSDVESESTECPQLEYILEYVIRNSECDLPSHSLHDLLSLVCEEPSQPSTIPPYLLAAGCRAIFTPRIEDVFFEEAFSALEQLNHLEKIRQRYVRSLRATRNQAGRTTSIDKIDRETSRMYNFTWTALRRWTLINEIKKIPFTPMNCLAMINVLFSKVVHEDASRERMAATALLQKVKQFVAQGAKAAECQPFCNYENSVSYSKAFSALSRYLDLSQDLIASIEDILDPVSESARLIGIRRTDCVMHRISRHLVASRKNGFDPEDDGAEELDSNDYDEEKEDDEDDEIFRTNKRRASQSLSNGSDHSSRPGSPEI